MLAVVLVAAPIKDHDAHALGATSDLTSDPYYTVLEADALLEQLLSGSPTPEDLAEATELYLHILTHLGEELSEEEHAILVRHVAQLLIILPEELKQQLVVAEHPRDAGRWELLPVSEDLLAWWRQQNPLPATRINERLREHLVRVAYAQEHYPHRTDIVGVDDRGRTLIKYGVPARESSISYTDSQFYRDVFRFGVNVSISDFPDNELWLYPHIDRRAFFLFIERSGGYEEADPQDLIPRRLRSGLSGNESGMNRAVSALGAMRYIYRELAMHHINFSRRYSSVDDYLMRQEEEGYLAEMGVGGDEGLQQSTVGYGVGQEREVFENPLTNLAPINEFAQRELSRSLSEDREHRRIRDLVMPSTYSEVLEGVVALPVAFRWARFLDDDHTTRTEFYWAVGPGDLRPTGRQHELLEEAGHSYKDLLLQVTTTRYSPDYLPEEIAIDHHLVRDGFEREDAGTDAKTVRLGGTDAPYHLAVQWNQHLFNHEREDVDLEMQGAGPVVKIGTARVDSLDALDTSGFALEMSDLKPLDIRDEEVALEEARPYPFESIAQDTPLALYFEVYNLVFDEDDRTRFTVEYEVHRTRERGGLAGLIRGDEEQRTISQSSYEAEGRRAEEYVVVDLGDYEDATHVSVTVRVTDDTTGEAVERAIGFEIAQAE